MPEAVPPNLPPDIASHPDPAEVARFSEQLVCWQRQHGRHGLPWQVPDAYRRWLSEVMLQQTQVTTVLPYYQRFVSRFPDVMSLAQAHEDEVMGLWSGLGYYSRARLLHRCAQTVVSQHGGVFPDSVEALQELPGIGPSTAGAIAAFAFGKRAAILDGNVKRVLARWAGIDGWPGDTRVSRMLWAWAERVLPPVPTADEMQAHTQGLMDLGATVCTRSRPRCERCPVADGCVARRAGRIDQLPSPRPVRQMPQRACSILVLIDQDRVLLERRPASGIWGGLWSVPERPLGWHPDQEPVGTLPVQDLREPGVAAGGPNGQWLGSFVHVFTHFRLTLHPWLQGVQACAPAVAEPDRWIWVDTRADLAELPLPAPIRKLLQGLPTLI